MRKKNQKKLVPPCHFLQLSALQPGEKRKLGFRGGEEKKGNFLLVLPLLFPLFSLLLISSLLSFAPSYSSLCCPSWASTNGCSPWCGWASRPIKREGLRQANQPGTTRSGRRPDRPRSERHKQMNPAGPPACIGGRLSLITLSFGGGNVPQQEPKPKLDNCVVAEGDGTLRWACTERERKMKKKSERNERKRLFGSRGCSCVLHRRSQHRAGESLWPVPCSSPRTLRTRTT